jgi:uncharacterized protein (DUF1778 family)
MASSTASLRSNNINIRVTPETLGVVDRAARAAGKTRTDFIVDTVRQAAEDAVLDQRMFLLGPESWEAFMLALDAPAQPNERLAALLARKPTWEE